MAKYLVLTSLADEQILVKPLGFWASAAEEDDLIFTFREFPLGSGESVTVREWLFLIKLAAASIDPGQATTKIDDYCRPSY